MSWTPEQIEQIPEVYRDFMLVLKPIPDSGQHVLRSNGIPLSKVFNALRLKYQYEPEQVRTLADNLKKAGFIEEDDLGFFKPTGRGEALIGAIVGVQMSVPALPDL